MSPWLESIPSSSSASWIASVLPILPLASASSSSSTTSTSLPASASAWSCSIRDASLQRVPLTKLSRTRQCGRPISVADPSLSIKELRAGYGSLDILNGVDLDVPQGQFVALMGPNGAGKSTLLKTLYGMTTIKGGSVNWQGKDITSYKSRAILAEGISWVPQGRCNFPVMT